MAPPPRRLVSLGTTCHVAQFLKESERKPESTPFDWIFSTPEAVAHVLADDFRAFLDPAQYVDHRDQRENPRRAGHGRYHDRMFNHHDPRRPEDHAYFVRCVERFRALGNDGQRLLFIMGHMNQRRAAAVGVYERLFAELRRTKADAHLLAIHHVPDDAPAEIIDVAVTDGLRVVQMSGSRSDGRHFESGSDDECLRDLVRTAEGRL